MVVGQVMNPDQKTPQETIYTEDKAEAFLLRELDKAIDDMENGRVQEIEEAWKEIDAI